MEQLYARKGRIDKQSLWVCNDPTKKHGKKMLRQEMRDLKCLDRNCETWNDQTGNARLEMFRQKMRDLKCLDKKCKT